MADSYNWIYARDLREIPEWIKKGHSWHTAVPIEKLQKLQMKVRMCCSKCEEKVKEEIREVEGVFDVRAEKAKRKVVVVVTPQRGDVESKVLRKARKVDKKAQFVELDAQEKVQEKPERKEEKREETKAEGQPLPWRPHWNPPEGETPSPPPGYFPDPWDFATSPQHPSTIKDRSTSPLQTPKQRSMSRKVFRWRLW